MSDCQECHSDWGHYAGCSEEGTENYPYGVAIDDMCCGGTRMRKGCEYHDHALQPAADQSAQPRREWRLAESKALHITPPWVADAIAEREANAREIDQSVTIGGIMFLRDEFVGVTVRIDEVQSTSGFLVVAVRDRSEAGVKLAAMFVADAVTRRPSRLSLSAPEHGIRTLCSFFKSRESQPAGDLTTYTLRFIRNQQSQEP